MEFRRPLPRRQKHRLNHGRPDIFLSYKNQESNRTERSECLPVYRTLCAQVKTKQVVLIGSYLLQGNRTTLGLPLSLPQTASDIKGRHLCFVNSYVSFFMFNFFCQFMLYNISKTLYIFHNIASVVEGQQVISSFKGTISFFFYLTKFHCYKDY